MQRKNPSSIPLVKIPSCFAIFSCSEAYEIFNLFREFFSVTWRDSQVFPLINNYLKKWFSSSSLTMKLKKNFFFLSLSFLSIPLMEMLTKCFNENEIVKKNQVGCLRKIKVCLFFSSSFVPSISFSEKEKVVCFCSFVWDILCRVWKYFLINSVSIFFYFLSLFVMALRQPGRFDTTRKTCSISHCSWFRMQPWVYFIKPKLTLSSTLSDIFLTLIKDASFQDFVNSPSMSEIKERSCFIHVDVPGHADNSGPLADKWVAWIRNKWQKDLKFCYFPFVHHSP